MSLSKGLSSSIDFCFTKLYAKIPKTYFKNKSKLCEWGTRAFQGNEWEIINRKWPHTSETFKWWGNEWSKKWILQNHFLREYNTGLPDYLIQRPNSIFSYLLFTARQASSIQVLRCFFIILTKFCLFGSIRRPVQLRFSSKRRVLLSASPSHAPP